MLLRGAAASAQGDALEVYLLRRVPAMAFAPGAYVFPGGGVDPRDADAALGWAGPSPAVWASQLGADEESARALVCAAVRETFEESGVLLAGPSATEVVADTRGDDWEADRRALLDRSLSLAGLLERRGLVLRSDLLRAWSRWITPVAEPRRFDTRFFAAVLPRGQRPREVGGEADRVAWLSPSEALAGWRRGELDMLPPTAATLRELSDCGTLHGVLGAEREISPIMPEIREVDGTLRAVLPEGAPRPFDDSP
ncbi:NUDIX hydrolase [Salinactinospora qingdaonensis]